MVTIQLIQRKSHALTPSALACLASVPTLNLTSGCAHRCVYCYTQGYSQYPGDGTILVYSNTIEQIADELRRRRRKPAAVYFSPSSDAFQPIEAVLDQAYHTMRLLLESGVDVQFVTKGLIPARFYSLFEQYRGRVCGQVGLTTLDRNLVKVLEPGAAPVDERLTAIERLTASGVEVSVRADPLICGVTDGDAYISPLFAACRERHVRAVAASYLFLRPAIAASLRRHIADKDLLERILAPYRQSVRFRIRGGASGGAALPEATRRAGFDRLAALAAQQGITLHLCGCKNPDITTARCHLTRPIMPTQTRASASGDTPLLWNPLD